MESIQIYLTSTDADKYNGSISDAEYSIPSIEIADGNHLYMSVQNVSIPYTFYNVNNSNNLLYYKLQNEPKSLLTIENGNYNITQLVDYLKSNIGLYITYNIINNKLTFEHPTSNFSFLPESTCFTMLGLINNEFNISKLLILISPNCVNIMSIKRINLLSNFITYNVNKGSLNNSSILCSIPVNKAPYTLIEYSNTNHFRSNLFINIINKINIKLVDEYENIIDLNGCHYSLTLQLDVESFQ
jgi:hypothetical protein